ncbi:Questin oxidase-like protein 1 [Elsinoe fawcettii]|nr:Questin oxidase-like protein 1 [Elsinoe fawcettii]
MTTTSNIQMVASGPDDFILAARNINPDSAELVSSLLAENHQTHDIYFNDKGFHNHIVHHLVTLLALGASPSEIQVAYDNNTGYQRRPFPIHDQVLSDEANFRSCLGKQEHYSDLLAFFRQKLEQDGIPATLQHYLFSCSPLAEDMLACLFAGVVHPLLHLGFALEVNSLPLVAEALAETAVHSSFLLPFFHATEEAAKSIPQSRPLLSLIHAAHDDPTFVKAARLSSSLNLVDSVLDYAWDPTISLLSQYHLNTTSPSSPPPFQSLHQAYVEQHTTLTHLVISAQHSSATKRPKMDFFLIHLINSSLFLQRFLSLPWLSEANKRRLLEWQGRHAVLLYMGMRCPSLHPEVIAAYQPRPKHRTWEGIFDSARNWEDDGHLSKVIRALAFGEELCGEYGDEEWCKVKREGWLHFAGVSMESVGGAEGDWVRFAGDEEAWARVMSVEEWDAKGRQVGRKANADAAVERIEGMKKEEKEKGKL